MNNNFFFALGSGNCIFTCFIVHYYPSSEDSSECQDKVNFAKFWIWTETMLSFCSSFCSVQFLVYSLDLSVSISLFWFSIDCFLVWSGAGANQVWSNNNIRVLRWLLPIILSRRCTSRWLHDSKLKKATWHSTCRQLRRSNRHLRSHLSLRFLTPDIWTENLTLVISDLQMFQIAGEVSKSEVACCKILSKSKSGGQSLIVAWSDEPSKY